MSPSNTPALTAAGKLGPEYAQDQTQQFQQLNTMLQMLRCVAYNSSPQVIPTGVGTALSFDTNAISIPTLPVIHDGVGAPTKFVAQADGFYEVMAQVSFTGLTAGVFVQLFPAINGGVFTPNGRTAGPAHATATALQVRMIHRLQYLDYVEFRVRQDNGGNFSTDNNFTFGSIVLLSRL